MSIRLSPSLNVKNASDAIAFYVRALGAREVFRLTDPGGGVLHAQLAIGEAVFTLAEENEAQHARGPRSLGGCSSVFELHLGKGDVDALFAKAVKAGAVEVYPPHDKFLGERCARVEDPFGHQWILSKTIEKVSPVEMQRRLDAILAAGADDEGDDDEGDEDGAGDDGVGDGGAPPTG